MKYAVIITYSFAFNAPVYLFPDLQSAKDFLKITAQEEWRIDIEEEEINSILEFDADDCYAKITMGANENKNITEFRIGKIYN